MAHNLETVNGKTSFAATYQKGQKAWHGLGQYVDSAMTAEQAITLANMDWTVEKKPIYVEEADCEFTEIENFFAATRTDNGDILSLVTDTYQIVQNRECFTFFDSIVDAGEAIYETAGVLGKGERVFLTAKLPADIIVKGDVDTVENYILLTNSHDGSSALQAGFTSIRVVCNNTLSAALPGLKNSIKLRHTSNIHQMLKEAAEVMGISTKYAAELDQMFNKMAKVKITDTKLREFIEAAMKPNREQLTKAEQAEFSKQFTNQVDSIFTFAKEDSTQLSKAARGTVWGAYNAISGFFGHLKDYKTASHRMNDIMYGAADAKIKTAFELATALV